MEKTLAQHARVTVMAVTRGSTAVRRPRLGIVLGEHTDADGATIFRPACKIGLEGMVSKRLSVSCRSGRSTEWLKIKNPNSSAMARHREERR
jgi:hypothetical protein